MEEKKRRKEDRWNKDGIKIDGTKRRNKVRKGTMD
jgi:hypothetical protein